MPWRSAPSRLRAAQALLDAAIDLAGGGEPLPMCLQRGAAGAKRPKKPVRRIKLKPVPTGELGGRLRSG
jgi:hypothetical protein